MPRTLIFDAAEARRIVEHALAAPAWAEAITGFDEKSGELIYAPGRPGVMLVHDEGVYLMSNGVPGDRPDPAKEKHFVAYAEGCHPEKDAGSYETARCLVGGDDFGETLPWAEAIKEQIDAGASQIRIAIDADRLELLPQPVPSRRQRGRASR